jgi:hypothetical protein
MFRTCLGGLASMAFGLFLLLYVFAGATLLPPGIKGLDWWITVIRTMFSRGFIEGTLAGFVLIVAGCLLFVQVGGKRIAIVRAILVSIIVLVGIMAIAFA